VNIALLLALASLHISVVMIPGANTLLITQSALAYSRSTGLFTVIGVAMGSGLYVAAGIIGFTALVSQSPLVYNVIRVIGALYFAYMGMRLLTRNPSITPETQAAVPINVELSRARAYRNGLLTSIANPAAALYFVSLFTSFIPTSTTLADKIIAGVMLVTISFAWYLLIAMTFSNVRVRRFYQRSAVWMNRLFGVVWLLLALKLLTA
jgi:threonine efflux protein